MECHEHYLEQSLRAKSIRDQDRAYRELGLAHKSLGNLQQALVSYSLKRPVSLVAQGLTGHLKCFMFYLHFWLLNVQQN